MIIDCIEKLCRFIPFDIFEPIGNRLAELSSDTQDEVTYLRGEDIFIRVMSYPTKQNALCRPEMHRRYIDIQSVLTGAEGIEIFMPPLREASPYDAGQDVVFYAAGGDKPIAHVDINQGYFAMIYPGEIHMPQIMVPNTVPDIKKFVIKINASLLKNDKSGAV